MIIGECFMSVLIKLYVLSVFSSDIIALNINFSEKKIVLNQKNISITKYAKHITKHY